MNARNPIKPKSIRLAILMALADGQITTIDDLLIKVDEPRNKLVNNAQAAHNEGLIKRMRDDVTNQAAYQITADGRKYLAKYADGSRPEPVTEPVARENRTTEPETALRAEKPADEAVPVNPTPIKLNTLPSNLHDEEIASMSRRLNEAFKDIDRLNKELEAANADARLARMARTVTHAGYVIQRPSKPLARFSKADSAKARALACARGGRKAQVFALVPIGFAQPGAEWKEA